MDTIGDEKLQHEVSFLNEVNELGRSPDNPGLLDGYLGSAIVCYLLAKYSGDESYAKRASQILEYISETGISAANLSFANGLTGVGWAVEWLVQNELMEETNTDEVLEQIDNIMYRAVSYVKDDNPTLLSGTLGKLAYFLKRAVSSNANTSRFKTIGHLECLVLLLDDLADKLEESQGTETSLTDLGNTLSYISSIKVKVNSPTSGKILYDSVNKAECILSSWSIGSPSANCTLIEHHLQLLYLAVSYLVAAKNRNNKYWQTQALLHIERIIPFVGSSCEYSTEQLIQKLTMFSVINVNSPDARYRSEMQKILRTLSSVKMAPTLVNGRGAVVLAELSMIDPGLISNWDEVMLFGNFG